MSKLLPLGLVALEACYHTVAIEENPQVMLGYYDDFLLEMDTETFKNASREKLLTFLKKMDRPQLTAITFKNSTLRRLDLADPALCTDWTQINTVSLKINSQAEIEEVSTLRDCPIDSILLEHLKTQDPTKYARRMDSYPKESYIDFFGENNADLKPKFDELKIDGMGQWDAVSANYPTRPGTTLERLEGIVENCDDSWSSGPGYLIGANKEKYIGFTEDTLYFYTDFSTPLPAGDNLYFAFEWTLSPEEILRMEKVLRTAKRECPNSYETNFEWTLQNAKEDLSYAKWFLHSYFEARSKRRQNSSDNQE